MPPAPPPSPSPDLIKLLVNLHEEHMSDLRQQVSDQRQLIQVLSDAKFFAPNLAKREPVSDEPYRPGFTTESIDDQPSFDEKADAEQVKAQDKIADDLEQQFHQIRIDQEAWDAEHRP